MDIGTLRIAVDARQATQATRELDGLSRQAAKTEQATVRMARQSGEALGSMRGFLVQVGATLASIGIARQLIQVQRQFDILNSSLETVAGSSAAARKEMEWIKVFAAETPYGLQEVTSAFVKMKAMGLDASQKSLESYGNTASAMGKSLSQMIEAVADAATSEFERLKEFGIKAKQNGDMVSLTFQGVTTTIGNNSEEITRYLQNIGNVNFAGAMERRSKTLDGALSNLSDSVDNLMLSFNKASGFSDALTSALRGTSAGIDAVGKAFAENETIIVAALGAIAGAAVLGGVAKMAALLGGVAGGIGAVRTAFMALTAVMAANPVTLALLGVGAAVGGFVAYNNAAAQTVEGMERRIRSLQDRIKQGPSIYARDAAGMAQWQKSTAAMRAEIEQLQGELTKKKGPLSLGSVGSGDAALLRAQRAEYDAMGKQRAEFLAATRTEAQKLNDELEKARKAFGGVVPPEVEASLRERFIKPTQTAAKSVKDLEDAKKRNIEMDNLVMRVILDNEEKIAKAIAKTQEEAAKAYADNLKIYEDAAKSAQDRVSAMELENEAIELAQRLQISMARAVELTTIARLKEKQVAAMGDEAAVLAIQREIDAREKLVQMMEGREIKEASEKLRRDEESAWAKTWEQISQSFTDELMRGGKSIAEYLKNLFKTLVLRPIIDPIGKGLVGILSGGGGTAMAGQGGVGGAFNIISSLQGAYSQLTGGLATTLSGVGSAVGSIGAAMQYGTTAFSQQSMMLAAQEAGMGTTAGTMGTAATALGGALVGFMAGKMISGGYSAIGKSGNASTAAGTAIGFAVGGPIGAAIGGALGGVFNRAFGRKAPVTTGQGITGTFSTSGADVAQFEDWFSKGGWFRSNKSGRNYSSVSSELDMFLDDSLRQITAATREYASVLGLNAKAIDGITQSVTLNMMGMNAEQQQAEIAKALGGFGDRLAQELLGAQAGKFVRAGETAGDALARMGQSLIAVNTVFDTLNQRLMETSLRGGDAASSLIEAFGSLENFTNATTAYYNAFYTEQERTATTTRQLTQALAQMGIALPATRDQFRAIVEAQDLYTDSGRATYAALLQLAPAFDVVMQAADRAAEDAKRAADAFAETMKRLGSSISDEVRRLRGLLVTDSPQARAALEAQFAMTTAQARAGDQSALERLPGISQALEQAAMMTARSAADVARMRGWLAGSMSETLKLLGLDVPQFAVGTNYVPRDTLAMIHEGEAIVPKAYNPAANGGDDVAFEMRALREEVSMLRHEARSTALNTDKARRIWERVTRDGESMQVTVTP